MVPMSKGYNQSKVGPYSEAPDWVSHDWPMQYLLASKDWLK